MQRTLTQLSDPPRAGVEGVVGWGVRGGAPPPSAAVFALPRVRDVHGWLQENAY